MNLRPYLEFGVQTAYEAGTLTLGYFGTEAGRPEFKADDTPVTVADREAERLIRERIEARFPKHAVMGEEYGEAERPDTDHRWIVDPIDGTKSFVRGIPLYGVLIGLEIEGVPPILREAGGYFGDWSGNETIYSGEAMSTTRSLLPEVLSLIEG